MTPPWNWKTSLNSGLYRVLPFAAATIKEGAAEAAASAATQFLLFVVLSGFTGALSERLRHCTPRWKAALVLMAGVPVCVHLIEWLLHELLHPGARRAGIFVSWMQSALSIGTQWALMREGLFLAGEGRQPYWWDFLLLPRAVRALGRRLSGR